MVNGEMEKIEKIDLLKPDMIMKSFNVFSNRKLTVQFCIWIAKKNTFFITVLTELQMIKMFFAL